MAELKDRVADALSLYNEEGFNHKDPYHCYVKALTELIKDQQSRIQELEESNFVMREHYDCKVADEQEKVATLTNALELFISCRTENGWLVAAGSNKPINLMKALEVAKAALESIKG